MGPPGVGKRGSSIRSGAAESMGGRKDWPLFQSHTFSDYLECLPIDFPEKEHSTGPCWVQPTALSAGLELGRLVLPVFVGPG